MAVTLIPFAHRLGVQPITIVAMAIGGSTNALVHLTAVARRLGIDIELEEFDEIGRKVPVLVDLKPSGDHYMEHFHWAGGNSRLMKEIRTHLDEKCKTVAGTTIKQVIDAAEIVPGQTVIRTPKNPIKATGGMAVLRGNLCPRVAQFRQTIGPLSGMCSAVILFPLRFIS